MTMRRPGGGDGGAAKPKPKPKHTTRRRSTLDALCIIFYATCHAKGIPTSDARHVSRRRSAASHVSRRRSATSSRVDADAAVHPVQHPAPRAVRRRELRGEPRPRRHARAAAPHSAVHSQTDVHADVRGDVRVALLLVDPRDPFFALGVVRSARRERRTSGRSREASVDEVERRRGVCVGIENEGWVVGGEMRPPGSTKVLKDRRSPRERGRKGTTAV